MFDDDWQLLGIERTNDLIAIKRAYAARLKTTRPDDDAEAYQALRGAYERAQQWARWMQQGTAADTSESRSTAADAALPAEAVATPDASPALPTLSTAEAPEAPAQPRHEPEPEHSNLAPATPATPEPDFGPSPERIVEQLRQSDLQHGGPMLEAQLLALQTTLEALPLAWQPEASARLADLVIEQRHMPDGMVALLAGHFGWRDDYRSDRALGAQRMQALQQVLDERLPRPLQDPDLIARCQPFVQLLRLHKQGGWHGKLRAQLGAALLGASVADFFEQLGSHRLRLLGFELDAQNELRPLLARAGLVRGVLLLVAVMVVVGLAQGRSYAALAAGWAFGAVAFFGHLAAMVAGIAFGSWFTLRRRQHKLVLALHRWHGHRWRPWMGIGALLVAAGGAYALSAPALAWFLLDWPLPLPLFFIVLALAGTAAAWPANPRHGFVLVACWAVASVVALRWLAGIEIEHPAAVAMALAMAWTLLAGQIAERDLWGHGRVGGRAIHAPQFWLFAPALNSLAVCDRWGHRQAQTPVALCAAFVAAELIGPSGGSLAVWWMLLVLAMGWGQEWLHRAGQRVIAS